MILDLKANKLSRIWSGLLKPSPSQLVDKIGSHELYLYKSSTSSKTSFPIFIIPSLINHPYILDLEEDKSLIRFLTQCGFDVYLLNWGYPEAADRLISFENLIANRLCYFIQRVQELSGSEKMHLMGHCLGGTLALMLACYESKHFQSLSLLTAPVDFSVQSKLYKWAQKSKIDIDLLIKAYGNVPWTMLHSSFLMMKPLSVYHRMKKYVGSNLTEKQKRSFWLFEMWSHDSVAFRGTCYSNLIKDLYQNNKLKKSELVINGRPISFANMNVPIWSLAAKQDHIVPAGSAWLNKADFLRSPQIVNEVISGGHVSYLLNKKIQLELWPKIQNWLFENELKRNETNEKLYA